MTVKILGTDKNLYEIPLPAYDALCAHANKKIREIEAMLQRTDFYGMYADPTNVEDAVGQLITYAQHTTERKDELEWRLDRVRRAVREPEPGDPDF